MGNIPILNFIISGIMFEMPLHGSNLAREANSGKPVYPAAALSRPVRNDVVALWGLDHLARLPWPPISFEESLLGSEWR